MSERVGREQLLAMLLARTPDHVVDALAASPEDATALAALRRDLADLALAPPPAAPPPHLRRRVLGRHPRPRRPAHPVLVVLDMINDHLTPGRPLEVPRARAIVPALRARLDAARFDAVPVIYACDRHEPEDPDLTVWPAHALAGTEGAEVWPALAPLPGEPVVTKPTYSAFHRSELAPTLEALGADALVLTGCATELGLLATAMDALQRGYVVTVPPDCQAGSSPQAEQMALLTLATMPPYDPIYLRAGR